MRKGQMLTTALAYALLALFFTSERRLRQGQTAQSLESGAFDRNTTRLIGAAFLVSLVAVLLAPILNIIRRGQGSIPPSGGWVGLSLMAIGIGLRTWANTTLGAFYTRTLRVTAQQHLIEQGPYRVLRHPGYAGSILLWIGAGFATVNWAITSVIAIVTSSAYVYRIQSEEAMLAQTFGATYHAYRRRTWKLLPLIY